MPLHSERKDITLVFSGEEYPDCGTVQELRTRGHSIGPAESGYLVHLYEEDPEFVRNLNGMFHGIIIDRNGGVLSLFNDRYGMHRLYYHEAKDAFYFATEAKAILAVRPELREANQQSMGELAACGCILENRTLFKDIHVLPGGSKWSFQDGRISRKETYFDPRQWEEQSPLTPDAYFEELRSVLSTVLPRHFVGQQKLGIAMTGGLDTRVILACHPPEPGSLPSYTFGGPFRESEDVRVGRRIASICRQPHQVIEVGDEFLAGFAGYAERSMFLSEGTVDMYRTADLYLSRRVRQIAPAKIVGTYGSEILRRAVMFKPVALPAELFSRDFQAQVSAAGDTYAALRRQHPTTFAAFRQSPWYHYGILALEKSQLTVRSPFMANDFVRTAYRAPREAAGDEDVRLRLIESGSPTLARVRSDRGVGGNGSRLASALSRASLELTFKAEYAYDYGMPPLAARIDHLLSGLHLERLFLGRHKLLHFRVWYRDQLSEYVRQILLDPMTLSRPYLERKRVEDIVRGHLSGWQNNTTAIHKLLTMELLHRLFLDRA
jgi:asparagine synthase (glutamine-hydrolysing)